METGLDILLGCAWHEHGGCCSPEVQDPLAHCGRPLLDQGHENPE